LSIKSRFLVHAYGGSLVFPIACGEFDGFYFDGSDGNVFVVGAAVVAVVVWFHFHLLVSQAVASATYSCPFAILADAVAVAPVTLDAERTGTIIASAIACTAVSCSVTTQTGQFAVACPSARCAFFLFITRCVVAARILMGIFCLVAVVVIVFAARHSHSQAHQYDEEHGY
jgi:hypothetical protein